ncbi:hypothetical protein [Curtobacterium sp. VKM Ac-1393]|uniref:hypothetical protein n=1 Tax=Curtobacterium sp. VKM Ac-1393 TaxID=2783814 RepID=UPI00188DBE73|nr:hypothetical protein [Curtobacterium sp. VKM Ac-1393]MBF4606390.1 hypothetical protein [Curtobacterium sp. VKM Ac-1393]
MGSDTAQHRRPTIVTVAVVIWWVTTLLRLVVSVPTFVEALRTAGGGFVGTLLGVLLGLGWSALILWLASRMARGSGTARLWLAIIAGFTIVNVAFGVADGAAFWVLLSPVAVVVAVVLSYQPSVRAFFPKAERRARAAQPRTLGWDPDTGERITEPTN